jgi:YVTN family beta-propeller protein
VRLAAILALAALPCTAAAQTLLPSGMLLTPTAAPGAVFSTLNPGLSAHPDFIAGQPVALAVSPDGKTLLVLTSGFNKRAGADGKPDKSVASEYVFVEDISAGHPVQKQVLEVPNSYMGLAFAPDGTRFYVSGGVDDDVHVFARGADGSWAETGTPFALGHKAGVGIDVKPATAGLAVSADGRTLVAANFFNDTVSVISTATGTATEVPLVPGDISKSLAGQPGGTYPFGVAVRGNDTAYVTSLRDREVDIIALGAKPHLTGRIKVQGNPNRLILNRAGTTLYVASDNEDVVSIIDTRTGLVSATVRTLAPAGLLADEAHIRGAGPDALALSPDEQTLYVSNAGTNDVAVVSLAGKPRVAGLIPVGYLPNAVALSADGAHMYVVSGRSVPGPNPGNCTVDEAQHLTKAACNGANQYVLDLSKGGLLDLPVPDAAALATLTQTAAQDDHFTDMPSAQDEAVMAALHQRIKHVIYIIRENRTYDEVLGDLGEGNGDPSLAEFGAIITPNAHALAANFVDLDHFEDTGEVSGEGWPWSTAARESDYGADAVPVNYAERGLSYDWEGTNRNIDVALPSLAARVAANPEVAALPDAANILPGGANAAAPDGPQGQVQHGYIWDAALRAGLSVRNYGFFIDFTRYEAKDKSALIPPTLTDPFAAHVQVAYPANPALAAHTDPYFRGFDLNFPDYYRAAEWKREFAADVASGQMPSLTLLRLMHDHLGSFKTAIDGVNTPETQMADNDYAVGEVVDAVAHSPFASSTLIFIVEDDAQNGPDHVDAHRSEAFIVGPYVRAHAVVSTPYSTVNLLRTMEDILGTAHLSVADSFQRPMADVFDLSHAAWSYSAIVPVPLNATTLPVAHSATAWRNAKPASWWAMQTAGYDWSTEDRIPAVAFNRILWQGLHAPGTAYPAPRGTANPVPDVDGD